MPKMIAKSVFEYGGRRLQKRETFEASSRDARVLALVGRAMYAESSEETTAAAPVTAAPEPKASRRNYRRRDLQAEG
jgi:hypothetical protein